jgi:hypothetical protein
MSPGINRRTGLALLAILPLFATGCACLYGGCGKGYRDKSMNWDGERCQPIEVADNRRNALGGDGAKLHGFGGAKQFYAACFWFKGSKDSDLAIRVQSGEFQPEIILLRRGEEKPLAQDKGTRVAQVEATLPRNGDYALVVTSIMPFETGDFSVSYAVN